MLAWGCDAVVSKPFHQSEIVEVLSRFLGVRFVREEAAPPVSEQRPALDLTGLPADWVAALRRAAIEADVVRIVALADEIRKQSPELAAALVKAAGDYDYEAIFEALASTTDV